MKSDIYRLVKYLFPAVGMGIAAHLHFLVANEKLGESLKMRSTCSNFGIDSSAPDEKHKEELLAVGVRRLGF